MKHLLEKWKSVLVLRCVLLGCALLSLSAARAQSPDPRIGLSGQRMRLADVFTEIYTQAPYTFFLNHAKVDVNRAVPIAEPQGPLSRILNNLSSETGYVFQVVDTHILVIAPEKWEPLAQGLTGAPSEAYLPSYAPDGGNNAAFVAEMGELAGQSRYLRSRDIPQLRASEVIEADTLWAFMPPVTDSLFTYPARRLETGLDNYTQGKAAYRAQLPTGLLKINLLYGFATLTPNLAFEIGLGRRTSLDIAGSHNPWRLNTSRADNRKMVHTVIKPEFRYWLCERFNGHFFGLHGFYWRYNVSDYKVPLLFKKEYQYNGHAVGLGLSYGYTWMWTRRWGMEFNAGVGVAFMNYKKKECQLCAPSLGRESKTYFGPTSAGIKLIWTID